jgi:CheY-like chemotaxis protein
MDESFLNDLRKALNNLYDLNHLRSSPLCKWFRLDNPFDAPIRLQHILEDAIGDLKPLHTKPHASHARETYELLSLRYLQQFSQKEVADQIGVSLSHMNRIQQKALEDLTAYLWKKYAFTEKSPLPEAGVDPLPGESMTAGSSGSPANPAADMAWMAVPSKEKSAVLEKHIQEVVDMLNPLLMKYPVELLVQPTPGSTEVLVYPAALRQILLMIITSMAQILSAGRIQLITHSDKTGAILELHGVGSTAGLSPLTEDLKTNLEIAHSLVHLSGGVLDFQFKGIEVNGILRLPVRASIPVLVVDDSRDALELLERFTLDTPYRVIAIDDPQQAVLLADKNHVQAIFLDIMMPRVDGWELLQKLRNHPATSGVPVVICSIMRQEELAAALGASAFLRKPVNQEALLALLDRLCGAQPA